jgi:hypothetical protein
MMKCAKRGILASCLVAAVLWVSGCKHEPNPPTEQDAIAVWKSTHAHTQKSLPTELVTLKKTNGQTQEINGQKVYTLYFEATQKNLSQIGNHAPGWVETYQSNYPFQLTEKGWLGPDGVIYPEH